MTDIHIDYPAGELDFRRASFLAKNAARQHLMHEPTIVSWRGGSAMSPSFAGGDPDTWWQKYGEGNGGRMEIGVGDGDEYRFIVMDTEGYETIGDLPLRNLDDGDGRQYLCYAPMSKGAGGSTLEDCSPLDEWTADQY
ncbi:MAG: AF1514 family protein [Pseudomonadota bacterium]